MPSSPVTVSVASGALIVGRVVVVVVVLEEKVVDVGATVLVETVV